jgi:hypothetical protein
LSFVVGSFAGEDDELDAATTLMVVLQMQQSRMLLVPPHWLAFIDDQVPQPKLICANIKFLMHLLGF